MGDAVHELFPVAKRRAARLLTVSSVLYVVLAAVTLSVVLAVDIPFQLPNSSWSTSARLTFFAAFMFPAVSVMSLIVGWVLYASASFVEAKLAALVPWLWGSGVLILIAGRLLN